MRTSTVVSQTACAEQGGAPGGRGRDEQFRLLRIPLLRGDRTRRVDRNDKTEDKKQPARRRYYRMVALLVAVAALVACSDLSTPDNGSLSSSQLLFLALQSSAPGVSTQTFFLSNSLATTVTLRHGDQFNTAYAEITFPAGAIARVGSRSAGPSDSVQVTLAAFATGYRVTLSPAGIEFSNNAPTLKFSASVYGNFSAATTSNSFATAEEYLAALSVWEEISPATWQELPSTVDALRTTVSARISRGGTFSLAAPR